MSLLASTEVAGRRRRAWWSVPAVAAALALAGCGDDEPDAAPPTTVDRTTSTSAVADPVDPTTSTTAPVPAPPELPATWVGVDDTGRLVVVGTDDGEVRRVLGEFDHPDDCPADGEPSAACQWVTDVALSPDGGHVFYETCCEPAPGAVHRVPIVGGQAERVAYGAHPALDRTGERLAVVELQWLTVHDIGGGGSRQLSDEPAPAILHGLTWSPDGERLAFARFEEVGGPGVVQVVEVEAASSLADATTVGPGGGRSWTHPTFRGDGALVVAAQELVRRPGEDEPAQVLVVDPDTGQTLEAFDPGGDVLSLHHDAAGELLVYVTEDGAVRWRGHDGAGGGVLVPGGYDVADW